MSEREEATSVRGMTIEKTERDHHSVCEREQVRGRTGEREQVRGRTSETESERD